MKLLVIGFDGIDQKVLDRGWTPKMKSLSDAGFHADLYEDMLSRGWSTIAFGHNAIKTGALYERPAMGGGHGWTESFSIEAIPGLGTEIVPFWDIANQSGLKVGIMNVPTTFPAPVVDGFFVSGGGGGGPVSENATPAQVHPLEVLDTLGEHGYVVDRRFESLFGEYSAFNPSEAFDLLADMVERRVKAFSDLSLKYSIDVGFIAFKSTVGAETLVLQELEKQLLKRDDVNQEIIKAAESYYRRLDAVIGDLIDGCSPTETIIVSDHSTVVRKASVNPNTFLSNEGYQPRVSKGAPTAARVFYDLIRAARHLIPMSIRVRLKQNKSIRSKYESMTPFNASDARAFCMAHSNGAHGIYINDVSRFGGPVAVEDIPTLAAEIAAKFEADEQSCAHGFKAYVKSFGPGKANSQFPDIVLDLPDGYQTSIRGKPFVELTPLKKRRLSLHDLAKDLRLTAKGHKPLALSVNSPWGETTGDLRTVYKKIVNIIEGL